MILVSVEINLICTLTPEFPVSAYGSRLCTSHALSHGNNVIEKIKILKIGNSPEIENYIFLHLTVSNLLEKDSLIFVSLFH